MAGWAETLYTRLNNAEDALADAMNLAPKMKGLISRRRWGHSSAGRRSVH
jgi:hypothetical protein